MTMHFETDAVSLRTALDVLASACNPRHVLPALTHVRVHATDGTVCLTTTDLDVEAHAVISATIETPGATCLPMKDLRDALKGARGSIRVALNSDAEAVVACGGITQTLATIDVEDFPEDHAPYAADAHVFDLPAADLVDAITRVLPAVAPKDESRESLTQILMEVLADGSARLTATDGRRAHRVSLVGLDEDVPHVTFLLRADAARVLIRAAGKKPAGVVHVVVEEARVSMVHSYGNYTIRARRLHHKYPDLGDIIPSTWNLSLTIHDPAGFVRLLAQAKPVAAAHPTAIATGQNAYAIVLDVTPDRTPHIQVRNTNGPGLAFDAQVHTAAAEYADAKAFTMNPYAKPPQRIKNPYQIGIDVWYLMDAVTALRGANTVTVRGVSALSMFEVTAFGRTQAVVMPVRLKAED